MDERLHRQRHLVGSAASMRPAVNLLDRVPAHAASGALLAMRWRSDFVWTLRLPADTVAPVKHVRRYSYVGPPELRDWVGGMDAVTADTATALARWLAGRDLAELVEPFTFIVAPDGNLRLAPRRSEHVALAGGHDVLAAGEIAFARADSGWHVVEVTNQSTGYCPDPDCWPAVGEALDRIGVRHPDDFTDKVIFRCCPACGERNIVRDNDFTCAQCDSALPTQWNFASNRQNSHHGP